MDEVMSDKNAPVDNKKTVSHPKNKKWLTDKKTTIVYFIVATLLPSLVFSIIYFGVTLHQLSVRLTEMSYNVSNVDSRTVGLEKRQAEFSGQLIQLDGRLTAFSNSPVLKEAETLAPRVNLLEKQLSSIHVRQKVTPVRSNPVHAEKKQYYEIKEGDTLFQISRKHALSVEELARMNDLYQDELIMVGQKLVVSK
jgi:LysM repeat protein